MQSTLRISAIAFFSILFMNALLFRCSHSPSVSFSDDFNTTPNRVWVGEQYWAIPLEDWSVNNGRIEFKGTVKRARVNLLTYTLDSIDGNFELAASFGLLSKQGNGSVGFSVGVKDSLDADVRAACYFGTGIDVGVSLDHSLFIADQKIDLPADFNFSEFTLQLSVKTISGTTSLSLTGKDSIGHEATINHSESKKINGIVALINSFAEDDKSTFWFDNVSLSGNKVSYHQSNSFGPILWTMHTLNKKQLKMSVQMPPIGKADNQEVVLEFQEDKNWKAAATQRLDTLGYQAIFTVDDWDDKKDQPYRIKYENGKTPSYYEGVIRKDPVDRPLEVGGLTCQEYGGYPYTPLVKHLTKKNPDLLYFSGDQLYERNGGYPIKRTPVDASLLSYLGKWYMFGWTFGDIMRDRPTICTPDDHDVFQGNLWGEDGKLVSLEDWKAMPDAQGGFVQSPTMVNTVFKTQCGHLPKPPLAIDTASLPSGIDVWYTQLVYGNVGFAILSDRMFKSGPEELFKNKTGRIDHITDPMLSADLDKPTLSILGQRQINFLRQWITNWDGATVKVLLTQTVFSNIPTHHGADRMFLYGDLDSGGWPKSARDEVVEIMRKGMVFHLNGDQHIPMIVKYGLDNFSDAGWSFCTPAISTGYMRGFFPDSLKIPMQNRPAHNLPNTGDYTDVFGNKNFVYAVASPPRDVKSPNRYTFTNNKTSGFGMLAIDAKARTFTMHAYPFLSQGEEFPGWPLTVHQTENDGRKPIGYLPTLRANQSEVVVTILQEPSGVLVGSFKTSKKTTELPVFAKGTYTLVVEKNGIEKRTVEVNSRSQPDAFIDVEF